MNRYTRRRFLGLAGGAAAALLAACTDSLPSASPASGGPSVPPATPTPTVTSSPTATPEPIPDLRTRIAQMLLVGFRGTDEESASATIADIAERRLGGVVLFGVDQPTSSPVRNIVSAGQLAGLTAALQSAAAGTGIGLPLLVAIDQEGGQVARLGPSHGFPATESAAELGALDDAAHTREAGRAIGQTLRGVGVNLNLAPVVDLDLNPTNPIIGALDRSFSADPDVVIRQASAFVSGCRDGGVLTTLKHFPGHGSSTGDTHLGVVDVTDTWREVELDPYRSMVPAGMADAVLTAHVFNAHLDPQHPATLSQPTITGLLRDQIGYEGVVLSDDMQMGAIRDAYGYEEAVALAIEAGVDVLTIANQVVFEDGIVQRTVDIIAGHVESGRISDERIAQSWARIQRFKRRMA